MSYISRNTDRHLYANSGNKCAFPGCDIDLVTKNGINIAERAHIIAQNPGGKRYKPLLENELHHYDNIILLCPTHHTLIDKSEEEFSAETIKKWKVDHEILVDKSGFEPDENLMKIYLESLIKKESYYSKIKTRLLNNPQIAISLLAINILVIVFNLFEGRKLICEVWPEYFICTELEKIEEREIQLRVENMESARNQAYMHRILSIENDLRSELSFSDKKEPLILSEHLVNKIIWASNHFERYRYSDRKKLKGNLLSPERGELLSILLSLPLDTSSYNEIFLRGNFKFAYIEELKVKDKSVSHLDISNSQVGKFLFYNCLLNDVNLKGSIIKELEIIGGQLGKMEFQNTIDKVYIENIISKGILVDSSNIQVLSIVNIKNDSTNVFDKINSLSENVFIQLFNSTKVKEFDLSGFRNIYLDATGVTDEMQIVNTQLNEFTFDKNSSHLSLYFQNVIINQSWHPIDTINLFAQRLIILSNRVNENFPYYDRYYIDSIKIGDNKKYLLFPNSSRNKYFINRVKENGAQLEFEDTNNRITENWQ